MFLNFSENHLWKVTQTLEKKLENRKKSVLTWSQKKHRRRPGGPAARRRRAGRSRSRSPRAAPGWSPARRGPPRGRARRPWAARRAPCRPAGPSRNFRSASRSQASQFERLSTWVTMFNPRNTTRGVGSFCRQPTALFFLTFLIQMLQNFSIPLEFSGISGKIHWHWLPEIYLGSSTTPAKFRENFDEK